MRRRPRASSDRRPRRLSRTDVAAPVPFARQTRPQAMRGSYARSTSCGRDRERRRSVPAIVEPVRAAHDAPVRRLLRRICPMCYPDGDFIVGDRDVLLGLLDLRLAVGETAPDLPSGKSAVPCGSRVPNSRRGSIRSWSSMWCPAAVPDSASKHRKDCGFSVEVAPSPPRNMRRSTTSSPCSASTGAVALGPHRPPSRSWSRRPPTPVPYRE